jgi:dihydrolipoamide dehydrogenase
MWASACIKSGGEVFWELSSQSVDVVIIGAGPGGYVAALRAAGLGASVALVERDEVGGTCLNRGCIPTKAILASTGLLRDISRSGEFGISVGQVSFDASAIAARSRGVVETMRKGVEGLLAGAGIITLRGMAVITGPRSVEVTMADGPAAGLQCGALIIATGSEWIELPGLETDGERVITSDDAFALDDIPASIAIVGGGAVGCEFAEIYSALGAETTIVEMMPQLLPGEDQELARRLEAALKRKGIKVAASTRVTGLDRQGGTLRVLTGAGKTLEVEKVMVAVGRKPGTAGLGLEAAGLEAGNKCIETDARMQTSVPGVYAIGDVTGKYLLAHVASAQGVVAAESACGLESEIDYTAVPRCVYTSPEYAAVGMGEAEAAEAGLESVVYKVQLGRVGRALTLGETFGLAKMTCVKGTGRVIGFHLLAPHASEVLTEVSVAMVKGTTAEELSRVIHPHPTMSEIVWEAAQGAAGKPLHG